MEKVGITFDFLKSKIIMALVKSLTQVAHVRRQIISFFSKYDWEKI